MTILLDYSFLTVVIGTAVLSVATSMVGTLSVLTGQSLIGDTLGHASYPGIIVSFMIFQSRNPILLMLGAMLSGYTSYYTVHFIKNHSKHSYVNALALVSASFFGLGMVLKNFIQGHEAYAKASQAGLQKYLFGQAAFIQADDVMLILAVSSLCIILFLVFYQRYKLLVFDPTFAFINGVPIKFLNHLTTFMMISLIAIGLKVVGAILISSFLIAPAITGILWSKHYHKTLIIAVGTGVISAFVGTYVSSVIPNFSTGPAIIVFMSSISLISFVLNTKKEVVPHG